MNDYLHQQEVFLRQQLWDLTTSQLWLLYETQDHDYLVDTFLNHFIIQQAARLELRERGELYD